MVFSCIYSSNLTMESETTHGTAKSLARHHTVVNPRRGNSIALSEQTPLERRVATKHKNCRDRFSENSYVHSINLSCVRGVAINW